MSHDKTPSDAESYAAAYRVHATTLRNWLVAYGAGGPALFLSQEGLRKALKDSGDLAVIGWLFFAGVVLQVTQAFIDKYADWVCYQHHTDPSSTWPKVHAAAVGWVNSNFPSVLIELASMFCLGLATVAAFRAIS